MLKIDEVKSMLENCENIDPTSIDTLASILTKNGSTKEDVDFIINLFNTTYSMGVEMGSFNEKIQ